MHPDDTPIVAPGTTVRQMIKQLTYVLATMENGSDAALEYVRPDLIESIDLLVPAAEYVETRGERAS